MNYSDKLHFDKILDQTEKQIFVLSFSHLIISEIFDS